MLPIIIRKRLDEIIHLMPSKEMTALNSLSHLLDLTNTETSDLYQILEDDGLVEFVGKPDFIQLTKKGRKFKLESKFMKSEVDHSKEQLFNVYLGYSKVTYLDRIIVNINLETLEKIVTSFHQGAESIFVNGEKYSFENINKIKIFKSDRPEEYYDYLTLQANKGEVTHNKYQEVLLHSHDLVHLGPDVTNQYIANDYGALKTIMTEQTREFTLDIFLSHSHKDKEAAKMIADLISKAFNLANERIRCTSAAGYKFRGGTKTLETLRNEVENSKLLIVLITENSVNSDYVLFELGARWGLQMNFIPLFYNEHGAKLLPGPLSNIIGLNMSDSSDMHQLIADVADYIGLKSQNSNVYNDKIGELVSFASTI